MKGLLALMLVCVASHLASCDDNYVLMDNVLVLGLPHVRNYRQNVLLECGEAYANQEVFWKQNGVSTSYVGNKVSVLVEEMVAGNFTCHLGQNGPYLNHTLVLVQYKPDNQTVLLKNLLVSEDEDEESTGVQHIMCSGYNYGGSFHCRWSRAHPTGTVLLVKAERNATAIDCELEADGSGARCNSCLPLEEQHRILLEVTLQRQFQLETYLTEFHLRDIVRPKSVTNLRQEKLNEFHWDLPEFWDEPQSYYPLQYEVKRVARGASCHSTALKEGVQLIKERLFISNFKSRRFTLCVRAADKLTGGPRGEWSALPIRRKKEDKESTQ